VSDEPTPKQLAVLRRHRIPTAHVTRETAHKLISEMEQNGWRRPDRERLAELIVGDVPDMDFGDVDDHGDL
jgi:hypothetical protein